MQVYLLKLQKWCEDWGISVNAGKTECQFFTRKKLLKPNLIFNNVSLKYVNEHRILGIIFDSPRLTWRSHTEYLVNNCTNRIQVMKHLASSKWGSNYKILKILYIGYIRSKIGFCATTYSTASKTHIEKLEKIQNACLRLILGVRRTTPILSMEAETNIPPLKIYLQSLVVLL